MATQAEVDQLTAQVQQVSTDLATAQTQITALENPIDLAQLTAAIGQLPGQVEALTQALPQPPAPAA